MLLYLVLLHKRPYFAFRRCFVFNDGFVYWYTTARCIETSSPTTCCWAIQATEGERERCTSWTLGLRRSDPDRGREQGRERMGLFAAEFTWSL